jgi:hypothetical protein
MNEAEPKFRTEKYRWLKTQLKIDMLNIDQDIVELPVLLQEAGECTALAIEIRESAKEELEHTSAELASLLRVTDEKGKSRSETMIASLIPLEQDYKDKLASLSEARLDGGLWMAITEAIRTKSSALRVTADLVAAGFMTSSSILQNRRREIRNAG